ncbi:Rrf2 family transcriptional regulator [Hyphomicrobium sp.]|jgi:Rrf2 family nitric oxide-sensitive transcriptional repressor|uniref:RrF2 family transcriptional regulator n=1 Tax=Hyphomicrobium sp. TaxID=82 RepID=UPI002CCFA704|nr:Rrf2 family transcriptional regulator [Hyphomicrobium sp.]HVZ05012.1 Rrf2 family transcriptional regulator [Hyphomicrobium sp.]
MRLTVHSDYALRVLMFLGVHTERLATIEEIAKAYGISENHLMKVVNRLAKHGFVQALRGRGGGLRLGKPADAMTLGEILRCVEDDFQIVECFGATDTCRITKACRLKHALRRALDAYLAELDEWTLADIVSNRKALLTELRLFEN